jgi:hypothetical protein
MPIQKARRSPASPSQRRLLRAAVAMGTAATMTTMVGTVGAAVADAASSDPTSSVAAAPASGVDSAAEVEAIKQLKASYFANVDAKNWGALRDLLAPNVVVDTTGSLGPIFFNRDSFVGFTALTLSLLNTHHQGYDPQITLTSPTTADAVWTMQDHLMVANLIGIHGYGHYIDQYAEVDGKWVVTRSKLTRTRMDLVTGDDTVIVTLYVSAVPEGIVSVLKTALAAANGVTISAIAGAQNLVGAIATLNPDKIVPAAIALPVGVVGGIEQGGAQIVDSVTKAGAAIAAAYGPPPPVGADATTEPVAAVSNLSTHTAVSPTVDPVSTTADSSAATARATTPAAPAEPAARSTTAAAAVPNLNTRKAVTLTADPLGTTADSNAATAADTPPAPSTTPATSSTTTATGSTQASAPVKRSSTAKSTPDQSVSDAGQPTSHQGDGPKNADDSA